MYNQGDVLLVPVPFTDLSAVKKRPVLVVSNDHYNISHEDAVAVAITSNTEQPGIPLSTKDLVTGTLPKPSIIRADKIYTLSQAIVVKKIGNVTDAILCSIRVAIMGLISEGSN